TETKEGAMAEPFLGEIRWVPYNFEPQGWAFCDGQLLPISQNTALFSLLGTTYGGDGRTTFALPDLRGRVSVHAGQGAGLSSYDLGSNGGAESVTLTSKQLPPHAHSAWAGKNDATTGDPTNAYLATGGAYGTTHDAKLGSKTITGGGSSQPHENRPPY